jgi:hypothetical protein
MEALKKWLAQLDWAALGIVLLGSSVVSAWVTHNLSRHSEEVRARRDGYGNASRVLIRRAEYPYRVRRRVSNDPDVVSALVELGHSLQEDLAGCRVWVKSESGWVGAQFEAAMAAIDACVGAKTSEAWEAEPITDPAGMRLGGWGPADCASAIMEFETAVTWRFGWRRLVPTRIARRRIRRSTSALPL